MASLDMSLSKLWEIVKDMEAWHAAVHRVSNLEMTERLNITTCWPPDARGHLIGKDSDAGKG